MKNINMFFKIALLFVSGCILVGCNEDLVEDKEIISAPVVTEFTPKTGKVGTEINITGEYLNQIDTVWIGGGLAELKHRVNASELLVVVTSKCKTGKILVSGKNGKFETTEDFTMQYAEPRMTTFPKVAKANDEIYIEGADLDVVLSVYFGTTESQIISQSQKDIVVKVPYFEEDNVDIYLGYNTVGGVKQTGTSGKPFSLERIAPSVTQSPVEAEAGTSVTLTGENLTLIDEAWFGEYKATILQQTESLLEVAVPSDFKETTDVLFKLVYYGNKVLTVNNNFTVIVGEQAKIYYWENKTIFAQDESTPDNFFNAITGEIYSPCDYEGVKNNIHFFITISASSIQLNNPANSGNQTKNFKCGGVALPGETMPNIVKFRALDPTNEAENAYITKVKNKTLESITQEEITEVGITNAGSSTRRFYGEGKVDNQYNPGDVVLMQQYDKDGNVLKVGFIEVIRFTTTDAAADKKSSLTFNCYFQK